MTCNWTRQSFDATNKANSFIGQHVKVYQRKTKLVFLCSWHFPFGNEFVLYFLVSKWTHCFPCSQTPVLCATFHVRITILSKWFFLLTVKRASSNGSESYEKYRNPAWLDDNQVLQPVIWHYSWMWCKWQVCNLNNGPFFVKSMNDRSVLCQVRAL